MNVSEWISAARPKTLPAAVVPVLLGAATAWHDGVFRPVPVLVCLIFALLIQIGTNFANDYFDFVKGADKADRVGPRRSVASGAISPVGMLTATIVVFALAFISGLLLVPYGGWWLIGVGLLSIACGLLYTGGPFPLAYNGLGDVFVFIFFGLVATVATYFVQWHPANPGVCITQLPLLPVLASIIPGALSTNILVVNNHRDVEHDRRARKRTLAVRFGLGFSFGEYVVLSLAACAVPVALAVIHAEPWFLLPLVLVPWLVRLWRKLSRGRGPELNPLLGETARFMLVFALLLSAVLVLTA